MSKRKVSFDDLATNKEDPIWKRTKAGVAAEDDENKGERLRTFKQNHTLDSDEEEEDDDDKAEEQYGIKEDDVVEGAEDQTIAVDDGTKLTPFNLREEMSEGRFDADGNYFAKKDDDIRDNWLDNIDWVKIKERPESDDGDAAEEEVRSEKVVFAEMVELMKPGETITKALQRLGGGKKNQKRQSRKSSQEKPEEGPVGETGKSKEDLLKLTGLADDILCRGDYEVYGYTYERIQHLIKKQDEPSKKEREDPALDMFGDEVDKEKLEKPAPQADSEALDLSDVVSWEFKWEDKSDVKTYGPYSSEQMQEWVSQDYFKDGVYVRKVGRDQSFHSSKRVDFELFT